METYRIGPIRPPSEAQSLLLQVTRGCTWNKCKFCNLYRHTKFRAYTIDSIKEDIRRMACFANKALEKKAPDGTWDLEKLNAELASMTEEEQNCYYTVIMWLMSGGRTVFLQDGNSLALSGGKLTEVLICLKKTFPQIERITSYGRAENLSKVSAEEFAELKEAGLDRIHCGFESGSDEVLRLVNKGVTAQQQITAGKNIKTGGLELSVYFMPGLGGKQLTEENASGMAHVVREAEPDYVRIRTACVKPGTELYEDYRKGCFLLCSEEEKVTEIREMIRAAGEGPTRIVSDHIVNLLQGVKGSLSCDKEKMIGIIDGYLALPEQQRRLFQLGRRLGGMVSLKELERLSGEQRQEFLQILAQFPQQEAWTEKMNDLAGRYI